jgi:creatinine amidohydrolase
MTWNLLEANYAQVKAANYEVAVLPLGATEPHNLHLPYGTDVYEGQGIGELACAEAHRRGARVVLLPTIPYGTETNMREFPLAMNLNPSTLLAVIADLLESLRLSGIRKVVLLNSHGGNDFKPLLRELYGKTEAKLFLCNWYQMIGDAAKSIFTHQDDHAGEMETSLIMAFRPELVARHPDGSFAADNGSVQPTRFDAVNRGWVSITRPWHLLTTNTGSGNPHEASAEKGRALLEVIVDRLSGFLVELSESKVDDKFPF